MPRRKPLVRTNPNPTTSISNRPSPFLSLAPELRNTIYTYYLSAYPEVVVHVQKDTCEVAARAPLSRVCRQIRTEVISLLPVHATTLFLRMRDFSESTMLLAKFLASLDKQTIANMSLDNEQQTQTLTADQRKALQSRRSNRAQKSQSPATALRQFPALQAISVELECILGQKIPALFWQYEMLRKSRGTPVLPELRINYCFEPSARADDVDDYLSECEEWMFGNMTIQLVGSRRPLRDRMAMDARTSLKEHVRTR